MKTADLQDNIYTTLGDNITVNFDKLFLFVPITIPDAQTQIMFKDSSKDRFALSFDSSSTDRKTLDTQLEYQAKISSAQKITIPRYVIVARQTATSIGVPNKANNVAVFDNLNVRKYHVDIDRLRYPRYGDSIDYASNDYSDQYRDLKFLYKEFAYEELPYPFTTYTDMKTKDPIQVIDLEFQVDHINPKKIQLLEENRGATNNARLFMIVIRQREIKMIAEGSKIFEVTVF